MSRAKVTVTVTIDCATPEQKADAQRLLDKYEFKLEGLQKLDEKISKKDFLVTAATKDFLTRK